MLKIWAVTMVVLIGLVAYQDIGAGALLAVCAIAGWFGSGKLKDGN